MDDPNGNGQTRQRHASRKKTRVRHALRAATALLLMLLMTVYEQCGTVGLLKLSDRMMLPTAAGSSVNTP